jgi:hypothetical protein
MVPGFPGTMQDAMLGIGNEEPPKNKRQRAVSMKRDEDPNINGCRYGWLEAISSLGRRRIEQRRCENISRKPVSMPGIGSIYRVQAAYTSVEVYIWKP